jgi:hypothetical protein
MWFGNLVTTHWWSDTFLNEGFARYFQYFGTAEVSTATSPTIDTKLFYRLNQLGSWTSNLPSSRSKRFFSATPPPTRHPSRRLPLRRHKYQAGSARFRTTKVLPSSEWSNTSWGRTSSRLASRRTYQTSKSKFCNCSILETLFLPANSVRLNPSICGALCNPKRPTCQTPWTR